MPNLKTCDRCENDVAATYMWQQLPITLIHVCESCAEKGKNLCKDTEELIARRVAKQLL